LVHLRARGHPEFDHAAGPDLFEFLEKIDQLPQVMRITQPVRAEQIADEAKRKGSCRDYGDDGIEPGRN
jgi:hypothetical protein